MPPISYTTNRGRACKLAAGEFSGWCDLNGVNVDVHPTGNNDYALILDLVGFSDLRDINRSDDSGVTLQPQGFGYAVVTNARNKTTFPVTESDVNDEGVCSHPNASWNATGGTIQAKYLGKFDKNPYAGPANLIDIFDLGGLRQSPDGQPFTVTNIATYAGKPTGEA